MAESKPPLDPQDEIARLLALQLKISLGGQANAIREFARIGLGNARIAELLGTTTGTVKATIAKEKKKPSASAS